MQKSSFSLCSIRMTLKGILTLAATVKHCRDINAVHLSPASYIMYRGHTVMTHSWSQTAVPKGSSQAATDENQTVISSERDKTRLNSC